MCLVCGSGEVSVENSHTWGHVCARADGALPIFPPPPLLLVPTYYILVFRTWNIFVCKRYNLHRPSLQIPRLLYRYAKGVFSFGTKIVIYSNSHMQLPSSGHGSVSNVPLRVSLACRVFLKAYSLTKPI